MTTQDPKYKHKPSEKHTLEEVLKSLQDLIRNDLLDEDRPVEPAEKSATVPEAVREKTAHEPPAPGHEDFAPADPASGPVDFDAVMRSLKDLVSNELNVGDETAAADESPPVEAEAGVTLEDLADELAPLDEELTFEESMEIVPPPAAKPAMPELPGEISAEMLAEPEPESASPAEPAAPNLPGEIPEMLAEPESPPPLAPKPVGQEPVAPGTQQELLFDIEPPTIEARTPVRERPPERKPEASSPAAAPETPPQHPAREMSREPVSDRIVSDVTNITAEQNPQATLEEKLPTIEVEETFDENAYFETDGAAQQAPGLDSGESDGIVFIEPDAPALETSETSPDLSNEPLTLEDLTLAPEPEKPELKPETSEAPAAENLRNMPSVDFETVEFNPPGEKPPAPSPTVETPKPAEAPPSVTDEAPLARGTMRESAPAMEPAATETKAVEVTPGAEKIPSDKTTSLTAGEPPEPASVGKSAGPKAPETFSLDDIPVLNEVVAPPAGSALAGGRSPATEPPLPAPDRARDIVVRAVAKLNVEMRKTGGTGLDTKTILRLQQLIRQELEHDGEKS